MADAVTSSVDLAVLGVLDGVPVNTVPDVIARMRELDAVLPAEDGLKWFNFLYHMVTEQILADIVDSKWQDGPWLADLDVVFARLFFEAIVSWIKDPAQCPRAWVPLFERRHGRGIARVQFGMAGMNAHINRDLPVAVVRTCETRSVAPHHGSPQQADYNRVNSILEAVEIRAMEAMATGIIGEVAHDMGRLDDIVAMWNVRKARDAAWINGQVLWTLRGSPQLSADYLAMLDRMTGFAGRGLLISTEA
jgi:Family of unknown function (DUF5995)